jgi:hypothetical protein
LGSGFAAAASQQSTQQPYQSAFHEEEKEKSVGKGE